MPSVSPGPISVPIIRRQGTATQLLVDGSPFVALAGELHNSSASDVNYLETRAWEKVVAHNCNAVFAPVYWELVEPEEGIFDFSLVDGLLSGARRRGLRLIPLWFGSWKNGFSSYAPGWVKTNPVRFPRIEREPGRTCGALSALGQETLRADARAFRALMRHLRETDADHRTAVMVQVENEPGLLGAPRDRCPAAEEAFRSAIPTELSAALRERQASNTLRPELQSVRLGDASSTWTETFGEAAAESFMAWHIARFINHVAAEGRAEYPLPCYANSWLVQYAGQNPGEYPSGGPVSRMMDIWQIAAPELFALAPDIYLDGFAGICADYTTHGNPLLIPEAGNRRRECSAHALYSLGRHDAMGFAPFGIDSMDDSLLAKTYRLLRGLLPIITECQGTGQMTAILQGALITNGVGPAPGVACAEKEVFLRRNYRVEVRYHAPLRADGPPAAALLIEETPDTFLIIGLGGLDLSFFGRESVPGEGNCNADFLSLEEGEFFDGAWRPRRRLNGDELVLRFGDEPSILRATFYRYP